MKGLLSGSEIFLVSAMDTVSPETHRRHAHVMRVCGWYGRVCECGGEKERMGMNQIYFC